MLNDTFYRVRWYNTTAWPCTDSDNIMIQYVSGGDTHLVEVDAARFAAWLTAQLKQASNPAALYRARQKMENFLNQKKQKQ